MCLRPARDAVSRRTLLTLAGGLATAPLAWAGSPPSDRLFPARSNGRLRPLGPVRALYVPMPDGVRIALDIVLPADHAPGKRLPAVLSMTRYWRGERGGGPSDVASFYVPHGFAAVVGDVRGTGASFGRWTHHRSRAETQDFGQIIAWIAAQPWSDGQVVGVGNSYAANTADWMAERRPAALGAIVPRFPDYDPYTDLYFPGGVPNAYMGRTWGLGVKLLDQNRLPGNKQSQGVRPVDADPDGRLLQAAIAARADVPSVWAGLKQIVFRDDHPAGWQGKSLDDIGIASHAAAVTAGGTPIQTWAGWMDAGTANGAIHRFMTLGAPMRAYVGAWSHGGVHDASPYQPDDAPPNPSFDTQQDADLAFIDRCLGPPATRPHGRRLAYFTLGEERWKTTEVWPPHGVRLRPAYFAADGRLSDAAPTAGRASGEGADRYAVDFSASTGKANRWATNAGGADVIYGDRAAADRKCLCYTSAPLARALEITGHPIAELRLSADREDAAVFVYLEEVAPDGRVRYLTEGQFRALHRKLSPDPPPDWSAGPHHSFRRADALPLVPGRLAALDFALMPISVRIAVGHRIRIAIAGADADTFTRIPASGALDLTLHRRPGAASRILLPVAG